MNCPYCKGRGDHGTYNPKDAYWVDLEPDDDFEDERAADRDEDPGVALCDFCEGTGRLTVARRLWLLLSIELPCVWERWYLTTWAGERLWRIARHRNARRLARDNILSVWKRHGDRKRRLDDMTKLADRLEGDGFDQTLTKQRRLVWEAREACRLAETRAGVV